MRTPAVSSSPVGILSSQIGYERTGPKRVVLRGPVDGWSAAARLQLADEGGGIVLEYPVQAWGELWGSRWWVADFSALDRPGRYTVTVVDGATRMAGDPVEVAADILHSATWEHVALGQLERRQRLALRKLGWYDAGTHWQEANSHAACIFGLCDALELGDLRLDAEQRARLAAQIGNGADYLASLQDLAQGRGWDDGTLVHQSFKYDGLLVPGNVAKAAAAFARAARLLGRTDAVRAADYRARARRALQWLEVDRPQPHLSFNWRAHGMPPDFQPAPGPATTDLALRAWAEAELARDGEPGALEKAADLARRLMGRQVPVAASEYGLFGYFRQYESGPVTTKAWSHGMTFDDARQSSDIGNTVGLNLWALLRLLECWPGHGDAPAWRSTLERFAYGYFLPSCRANPFLICPNGVFPGQGLLWFAGLWHGANAIYGLAAAHALEFGELFGDGYFREIATGNLQWIAGLNAGVTRENLKLGSHLFEMDVPAGRCLPVSMFNRIGQRHAGSWLNIRGAICNGFNGGEQFSWATPPKRERDGPHGFSDEDWIVHAGAWLQALARL